MIEDINVIVVWGGSYLNSGGRYYAVAQRLLQFEQQPRQPRRRLQRQLLLLRRARQRLHHARGDAHRRQGSAQPRHRVRSLHRRKRQPLSIYTRLAISPPF